MELEFQVECVHNKSCEVMVEIPDGVIDLVVSSPPYYNLKEYSNWPTYKSYLDFIHRVIKECFRVMRPGSWICWNIQECIPFPPSQTGRERYCEPLLAHTINILMEVGFLYEKDIVWFKGKGTATQKLFGSYPYTSLILVSGLTEHIITARKPRGDYHREISNDIKEKSKLTKDEWGKWAVDLWEIHPASSKSVGHPAPYPIELATRCIRLNSFWGDVVLDPFFGAGTTGLAAKNCGRHYIGYETYPEYIRLAENRIRHDVDIFA